MNWYISGRLRSERAVKLWRDRMFCFKYRKNRGRERKFQEKVNFMENVTEDGTYSPGNVIMTRYAE